MALNQSAEFGAGAPTARLDRFLVERTPPTPCIVIDLDIVRARYYALRQELPTAETYYAVKANPAAEIVSTLATLGVNFDLAGPGEIDICLGLNISPQRLSFGNTIKRESAIARASAAGIDLFAFDSAAELEKLARSAPGAYVFCRLLIENKGAEWPLTRKFGCESHVAADLLLAAHQLGLRPAGVSLHVGSQQIDPQAWSNAIAHGAWVFRACSHRGVDLELINLGGGLPAHYRAPIPPLSEYARQLRRPSRANLELRGRGSLSSRGTTWSATPACFAPKFCSSRANRRMNTNAGVSRCRPLQWPRRNAQ